MKKIKIISVLIPLLVFIICPALVRAADLTGECIIECKMAEDGDVWDIGDPIWCKANSCSDRLEDCDIEKVECYLKPIYGLAITSTVLTDEQIKKATLKTILVGGENVDLLKDSGKAPYSLKQANYIDVICDKGSVAALIDPYEITSNIPRITTRKGADAAAAAIAALPAGILSGTRISPTGLKDPSAVIAHFGSSFLTTYLSRLREIIIPVTDTEPPAVCTSNIKELVESGEMYALFPILKSGKIFETQLSQIKAYMSQGGGAFITDVGRIVVDEEETGGVKKIRFKEILSGDCALSTVFPPDGLEVVTCSKNDAVPKYVAEDDIGLGTIGPVYKLSDILRFGDICIMPEQMNELADLFYSEYDGDPPPQPYRESPDGKKYTLTETEFFGLGSDEIEIPACYCASDLLGAKTDGAGGAAGGSGDLPQGGSAGSPNGSGDGTDGGAGSEDAAKAKSGGGCSLVIM